MARVAGISERFERMIEMPPSEKRIWFPAKKYGWGWGWPCAWQGWVVLAVYVLLLSGSAFLLLSDERRHFGVWLGSVTVLSAIFTAICWLKGEKPRWRWGQE